MHMYTLVCFFITPSVILLFEFTFTYSIKSKTFIILRAMNNLGSNQAQNLTKSNDKKNSVI